MEVKGFLIFVLIVLVQANILSCEEKKSDVNISVQKEVVVVGGGLAGMAAARHIQQDKRFRVKILEARRERYGGRIWTKRGKTKGLRGVDRELGGVFLNTKAYDGALGKLIKKYELEEVSPGSIQIHFPRQNGEKTVLSGDKAQELYTELFTIIVKAIKQVKSSNNDRPLDVVIREALDGYECSDDKKVMLSDLMNTLPTPLCSNFSTLLYDVNAEFGWNSILVDGVDSFLDRIVSGDGMELPLKVELNKVVRNIKIDDNRQKVLVRTTDRKQIVADAVILAVPIGVLKSQSIIIEPKMPWNWYDAIKNIGVDHSMKIVVGFDKAFWSKDAGTFIISSELATDGFLQMWTNAYKFSGNPFLIGNIFGNKVKEWEKVKKEDLQAKVIDILGEMFGTDSIAAHNITKFDVSNWSTDEFTLGSVSYPKVGSTAALWDSLRNPACPYLYFAGAHTESIGHVDSLHGAYYSGIRAANQILSGVCEQTKNQENPRKDNNDSKPAQPSTDKLKGKSKKQKKDEL